MRPAIFAVLFLASAVSAPAGNVKDVHSELAAKISDPNLRSMTARVLREMNTDYEELAKKGLTAKGERFDLARVEVTGVASNDNTYKFNQTDFDAQIKPSYTVETGRIDKTASAVKKIAEALLNLPSVELPVEGALDSLEFKRASAGETTPLAKKALALYKDKEINEIIAHSWGTELVYAAILNGELRPPKKLIVVGVPDSNYAKWILLADRTGTEVHWIRAPNDKIAQLGAAVAAKNSVQDYTKRWDALCSSNKGASICNAHGRKPKPVAWDLNEYDNPGTAGHDRDAYYALMKKHDVLKGTIHQLRAAEAAVKEAEISIVKNAALEAAMNEARGLIARAKEQALIQTRAREERRQAAAATSIEPVTLNPGRPSIPTAPKEPVMVRDMPSSPFWTAAPQIRKFAIAACAEPEPAPTGILTFRLDDAFYAGLYGNGVSTEMAIKASLNGLTGCPRKLYVQLIAMALEGSFWRVSRGDWLRDTVISYSNESTPQNYTATSPLPNTNTPPADNTLPSPTRTHDPEGEALRQLRAIEDAAMRKRFGLPPR